MFDNSLRRSLIFCRNANMNIIINTAPDVTIQNIIANSDLSKSIDTNFKTKIECTTISHELIRKMIRAKVRWAFFFHLLDVSSAKHIRSQINIRLVVAKGFILFITIFALKSNIFIKLNCSIFCFNTGDLMKYFTAKSQSQLNHI